MRRLMFLVIFILVFSIIGMLSIINQNNYLNKNTHIVFLSNVENSEKIQEINPESAGDYLMTVNIEESKYTFIKLDPELTLFDEKNKEYASVEYYRNKNFDQYMDLVGKIFDEKITDYYRFEKDKTTTNITDESKQQLEDSIKHMKQMYTTIETNAGYRPRDNNIWLRVFEGFEYPTDKLVNDVILNDFRESFYLSEDKKEFRQQFYLSFTNWFDIVPVCDDGLCLYPREEIDEVTKYANKDLRVKVNYTTPLSQGNKALIEYREEEKGKALTTDEKEKIFKEVREKVLKEYKNLDPEVVQESESESEEDLIEEGFLEAESGAEEQDGIASFYGGGTSG